MQFKDIFPKIDYNWWRTYSKEQLKRIIQQIYLNKQKYQQQKPKLYRIWLTTKQGFELFINIEAESEKQAKNVLELAKTSEIRFASEIT